MPDYSDLKRDCRHFRADRPCAPHKQRQLTCATCPEYDRIVQRILVVKLAATGDVLRTTSFLRAIHATFPGARLTWVTAPGAVDLFRNNPCVDEVLTSRDALTSARLAVEEFDVVLCPDADPEAASLAASARGRERRGFTMGPDGIVQPLGEGAEAWYRMGLSDQLKRSNRETYQALVARVLELDPALVTEPILEPSDTDTAFAEAFFGGLSSADDDQNRPVIGLNTGAGGRWEYKAWTVPNQKRFLELACDAGFTVVLLGGPEEAERHVDLLQSAQDRPVFDAGTSNSFGQFAALVDRCDVVLTSDSFAVHVATARKIPAVVLFGPTSAAEIELYGRGEKLVPKGLDCLCCYLPACAVTPHCQALIEPADVLASVLRQVAVKRAPAAGA